MTSLCDWSTFLGAIPVKLTTLVTKLEQVDKVVTSDTLDVCCGGSRFYLCRDTDNADCGVLWFCSGSPNIYWESTLIRPRLLPSKFFQFNIYLTVRLYYLPEMMK